MVCGLDRRGSCGLEEEDGMKKAIVLQGTGRSGAVFCVLVLQTFMVLVAPESRPFDGRRALPQSSGCLLGLNVGRTGDRRASVLKNRDHSGGMALLRLRGGGGENLLEQDGDFVVPEHGSRGGYPTVLDAVTAAFRKPGEGRAREQHIYEWPCVFVRPGGVDYAYKWDGVLRVNKRLKLRGCEGVNLRGVVEFGDADGEVLHMGWAMERDSSREDEMTAAVNILGGRWNITSCQLRGSEITVLAVEENGIAQMDDSFVGGFCPGPGCYYDVPEATDGIFVGGNATLLCNDTTLQDCGAWGGCGLRVSGNSTSILSSVLFYQNRAFGVSIHQSASLTLATCAFVKHGIAALCATMAPRASLRITELSLVGQRWADGGRPGKLSTDEGGRQDEVQKSSRPVRTRRSMDYGGEARKDDLQTMYENVDSRAMDLVRDWEEIVSRLEQADGAIEVLEEMVEAAGGSCRRVETGRQKLRPRETGAVELSGLNLFGDQDDDDNHAAEQVMRDGVGAGKKRKRGVVGEDGVRADGGGGGSSEEINATTLASHLPTQEEYEKLPPLLLASLQVDNAESTICVYVHVEPIMASALRDSSKIAEEDALVVESSDRFLSRRALGGDAARCMAWLAGFDAANAWGPKGARCNLKIVFDFLEEAHKPLLEQSMQRLFQQGGFFDGVDAVICMGGSWLTPSRPAITCGFRGLASVFARVSPHYSAPERPPDEEEEPLPADAEAVADAARFRGLVPSQQQVRPEVESLGCAPGSAMDVDTTTDGQGGAGCGADDGREGGGGVDGEEEVEKLRLRPVHSGYHGGALKREPMADAVRLCSSLHHPNGSIAVKRISELRRRLTEDERECLGEAIFDISDYSWKSYGDASCLSLAGNSTREILARTWFEPCVSVHGIQGGWSQSGVTCMIPLEVTAKIGLRLPPGMSPEEAAGEIESYMLSEIDSWGGTTNHLRVWLQYGCDAWRADTFGSLHQAIERATERVHGTLPELVFDGGSYPVAGMFEKIANGVPIAVLPLSFLDADMDADTAIYRTQDYLLAGVKLTAAIMDEVAAFKSMQNGDMSMKSMG